jgi:serine/threonine-protein kinase HipA
MTDRLDVWFEGSVAGNLERRKRTFVFVPSKDVALTVAARGTDEWSAELTRNWFDGLLPEGDRRGRIAGRFGLRPEDTFGLLAEIGWECAGAVAVMPPGVSPLTGTYVPLTARQVGDRLDDLLAGVIEAEETLRMSLGGAQEKLLLARAGAGWLLPIDGAPSTHILKPEPDRWPGLASAEGWALAAARTVTPASEAELATNLGSRPCLVVSRYDRDRDGDRIARLHQEDLCQALGLPPGAKYATPPAKPGGPSYSRLAQILLERAADPPAQLVQLLEQVTSNVALANADAHAKNASLLHFADGTVELAPLYDVVPMLAFLPGQTHVGLPIASKFKLVEIGRDQLIGEAQAWGIPRRIAEETVSRVTDGLRGGIEVADDLFPQFSGEPRQIVAAAIERAARTGRVSSAAPVAGRRPTRSDAAILRS